MFDLSCTRHLEYWRQLKSEDTRLIRPKTTLRISSSALYAANLNNGPNPPPPSLSPPSPHPPPPPPAPHTAQPPSAGVYTIAGEDGVCCYTPPSTPPSTFLPPSPSPLSSPWCVPPQRSLSRGVGPVSAALCIDNLARHSCAAAVVGQGDGQVRGLPVRGLP
jgi:hypothetical protein